ncbi:methylenetetrahydrofolate reductase [Nocardia vaccinii]|uniref:methylenetetrahydrofolate reductase n=1 Tax=Nocardia vaccinii TaxID=1822 RepID=UPI000829A3E9|nr:methylenetetrahydrofolate reductase [Nocardia vaccinii]
MTIASVDNAVRGEGLLADFSLEMTAKDIDALRHAAPVIPQGTHVNVTFLGNEDFAMRRKAAAAVKAAGFDPVAHISARRIASERELDDFMAALREDSTHESVFLIAGDPSEAQGPFDSAIDLITSGMAEHYGVKRIGIGGYPEGHPQIDEETLWSALEQKAAAISSLDVQGEIITQFGFDVDAVLDWIVQVRQRGIDLPIRVGVAGPAGVKRLISYSRRFGVGTSAGIAKKYGFSITNLLGTAGPDRFISELITEYDQTLHGRMGVHFYTFGGMRATAEWVDDFRKDTGQ